MNIAESDQTDQMQQMMDTDVEDTSLKLFTEKTWFSRSDPSVKSIKRKNDSTKSLPPNQQKSDTGRQIQIIKHWDHKCLTPDQARHIYKKVEKDSLIYVETIKH